MKKSFQKSLIAASVGAVMFAAAGTASANSLLFPFFTTASGASSVLSLSNTGTAPVTQKLHYVYYYGAPLCQEFNADGSLTANDIMSHSIASPTTAGGFGLVVPSDKSVPVYFPLVNQTGFLIVSSKTLPSTNALRGSMAIIDPATGLVTSFAGIDNAQPTDGANGANGEGNFSAINDVNFPLTVLPAGIVSTSFFAVVVGDFGPNITLGTDWRGTGTFNNNGQVFNNDEAPFSGTATKTVTCLGPVFPSDLANTAQQVAVGANGGLVKATFGNLTNGATGVVLTKVQQVLAAVPAPFGGKATAHREQGNAAPILP